MKWIHNLLKCFSFSAVLFTFQACYGCPNDMVEDYNIAVHVVDSEGNGIPNVEVRASEAGPNGNKILVGGAEYADTTGVSGMAYIKGEFWHGEDDMMHFKFKPLKDNEFQTKDTAIAYSNISNQITVTLERK